MSRYFPHSQPLIDYLKFINLNPVSNTQMTLTTFSTRMALLSSDLKTLSTTGTQTIILMISPFNHLTKESDSEEI